MTRLSLTTFKRKQRRQTLVMLWWNQVITLGTWLVISLFMMVVKYEIDKPRIRYLSSKVDQYSINDDEELEGSHSAPPHSNTNVEEASSFRSKKRKASSQITTLLESFNDAVAVLGDCLKESSAQLSESIKHEIDLEKKTSMITSVLSNMTSLNQLERFRAIKKIKSDPNNVMTFWDLEEDERVDWVKFMMSE